VTTDPGIAPEPAAPPEIIALEGVTVIRDGRALLRDVDWHVHGRERWVVLGPNGAGKTTMLQVASTYLGPTRGTVRLLGATFGKVDVRELRERVGYAGAGPAALVRDYLPGLEIVVTGKHASFVDRRWHEYTEEDWDYGRAQLERLQAGHLAERRFGTLSAGERQRVLIARSLMTHPELLLLDEATTGLDLGARERLVASLADLAADPEAPAVVLVTHHVEEIPEGFDNVVLLAGGTVVARGPITETLTPELLSETFGVPLHLERRRGRFRAWSPRSGA
jgi:iron complex transport system ATP-binding protein